MTGADSGIEPAFGGIVLWCATTRDARAVAECFREWLGALGMSSGVESRLQASGGRVAACFRIGPTLAGIWAPGADTLDLCARLGLDAVARPDDLEREILVAMLLAPRTFEFPSYAELAAAVRVRCNIVRAARRTALAFHTSEAERPADCWTYDEDRGFTILPGKSLIEALRKATQPEVSGRLYAFSCYRATEYVILLALAEGLEAVNPPLLDQLQRQWERRAIMSGKFHEVFLREHGSVEDPLPLKYYVPGDRAWFRNPDEHSSDVAGYEGSWVFYLGGGLFTNFWKRDRPYTLADKCLELYHWRHAVCRDDAGEPRIDESVVEARVADSKRDPVEAARVLAEMLRLRAPRGVYGGGCMDASREYPRGICPGTAELVLPDVQAAPALESIAQGA